MSKTKSSKKNEEIENKTVENEAVENEAETAEVENEAVENEKDASLETEKLKDELKAQKDSYLRLAAEYDNYRKRTQQEKLSIYADATAKAVTELLPLMDSVNAALGSSSEGDGHREGIELIGNQLMKCLEKLSVESFGEIGDSFDPQIHNAVARTEDESLPANSLSAVFQKGFKIGDKIIRPAMVQVANCG